MISTKLKAFGLAAAFVAAGLVAPVQVSAKGNPNAVNPTGNNGTLKVHELGTPLGTENNDPHVCKFNLEGFGFDANQAGYLLFEAQGQGNNTAVTSTTQYSFGPTNSNGYAISQDFNNGGAKLANGQYKVTVYGKDTGQNIDLKDAKSKSKVLRVECETTTTPETPTTPTTPITPGGEVLGDTTGGKGGPQVLATTTNEPNTLQDTGVSLMASVLGVAFVASAYAAMRSKVAETIDFDAISI